jgi:hypothetical protein
MLRNQCIINIEKNLSSKKSPQLCVKLKSSIYETFDKKANAISYIKESQSDLKLFSEDISETDGCKQFIVTSYDKIYQISKNKKRHLYENYEADQPLKLILDIDYKINDSDIETSKIDAFDDILVQAIESVNDKLKQYTEIEPIIIILKSCRKDKLSAHIIYTNIHFNNIKSMKCFMMMINSPLIDQKIIDPNIYRVGCMRMLWNSKMGKSNVLEYTECDFIDDNKYAYVSNKQLFMDCLLTNIKNSTLIDIKIDIKTDVPKKKIIPKKVISNKNMIEKQKIEIVENHEIETIKQYLDLIDEERADTYSDWVKIGMCIYNCNSSEKAFDLWDLWSKKSDKYNGRDVNLWKWNTFSQGPLTLSTLKYLAKTDNPELYDNINTSVVEKLNYEPEIIVKDYLLDINEVIKDQKSIISKNICDWMEGASKALCIKSPYNTGKTTMIKSLLKEFKPKKVLFITHRQSLTNELYGTFKKHGFCNYMNGSYSANRLICQIESLHKITESEGPFQYNVEQMMKKFDLVILDEIESILNHFSSPTVTHKQQTFDLMTKILNHSKKILALDGDFHNRSYDFISGLCTNIIIHNDIKKDIKKYTFISDSKRFDDSVNNALKENKNIVVVTMSSNKGKVIYEKYKDTYNSLLHTSKTDDQVKEKLKNVSEYWKDIRLLIYSPSVQSGVSFDVPHFDQMFVIMANKSCSARDLSQMTHRIRQFKNQNVLVYLNGLPYREDAKFYQYDQMVDYVQGVYRKQKSSVENMFVKNLVHNETEIINKGNMYIVPQYIKYIKNKGSKYEYQININKVVKEKTTDFTMQGIVEAEDIDDVMFKQYLDKQNSNSASEAEKYAVEKYMYKKNWGVDEINQEFMDLWFRKTHVLDNIKSLLEGKGICITTIDKFNKNNYLVYDKAKQKERVCMIEELVKTIGFDLEDIGDNVVLDRETFVENMNLCIKNCKIFKDDVNCEYLFGIKSKQVKSVKAFIGFVNSILKNWGLEIKFHKKQIREKNRICILSYSIEYFPEINNYL